MQEIQKRLPNKTVSQCRNFWMNNAEKLRLKKLAPSDQVVGLNAARNNSPTKDETLGSGCSSINESSLIKTRRNAKFDSKYVG